MQFIKFTIYKRNFLHHLYILTKLDNSKWNFKILFLSESMHPVFKFIIFSLCSEINLWKSSLWKSYKFASRLKRSCENLKLICVFLYQFQDKRNFLISRSHGIGKKRSKFLTISAKNRQLAKSFLILLYSFSKVQIVSGCR